MMSIRSKAWAPLAMAVIAASVLSSLRPVSAAPIDDLQTTFVAPPDDSRIMMRWWWFGPAVTKPELEREMRLMKEGGIGGFEVQPVYPLALDDESKGIKTLPFLSDEFLDAVRFTADKAHELGLRFDLTLGSGWPFGGPTVSINHAAGRLRYEHVKVEAGSRRIKIPYIGAGEKLLAVFLAEFEGKSIIAESIRELTNIRDGLVEVTDDSDQESGDKSPHSREVLFFISSRTGMQVKRPAVGAEGFVLDHMNRAATDSYLRTVGDRLMQAFGQNRPYAIFCDSLEVYNSDWSSDFLEEFQKRRGYDLKPHLPALVNNIGPQTKALRHDWGQTLTELLNERFLAPLQEWAKRNGTLFRIQDYGVPAATISSSVYADLPEGEGSQWKILRASRWASSASHLYSRRVTSSESWTWLHSPSFRATPLDIKAEADLHFLQGINQLIGHGWPYTAPGIEYPGWRFYAAAVFDEKNPWWIVMPDVAKYLQRVSYMMRQGQPANDVAVYLPNDDGWSQMPPGNPHLIDVLREHIGPDLMPAILEAGYNLDFFDDSSLKQVGRVEGGSLVLGQNKYKVVILPSVEQISIETYRKFEAFVRSGGILIATRRTPSEQPGFLAKPEDHNQIAEISKSLFGGTNARAHLVTNERLELGKTLNRLLLPDMELSPSIPDIGFVHRKTADADIYFIANTSNTARNLKASFRVSRMKPEWWNPFDGSVRPARDESESAEFSTVKLSLEPYDSRVLVFTKRTLPASERSAAANPVTIDLSAGWRVSVGPSGPRQWDKLHSWTDDESTRFFSGQSTYEKEVMVPANAVQESIPWRLDFGEGIPLTPQSLRNGMQAWLEGPVREAAVVYVNEKRAGSVWCPPYSLDVSGLVKPGPNKIRIVIGNTAMNYMAGHSLPDYRLLNLRYGERFQAQDMDKVQPLPSGLLGPVRLIQK